MLVENRAGGNGTIGPSYVARAKPDGYTLFMGSGTTQAASLSLFKQPPFDPFKDFSYACTTLMQGFVITVAAKSPIQNMRELTAHLKKKGSNGSYATGTIPGQVLGELYKQAAGLETVCVNYKSSGDHLNDLLSGSLDFAASDIIFSLGQEKAGTIRILGIGLKERMQSIPNIPTLEEQDIRGIDLPIWWLVAGPAGLPKPMLEKIAGWYDEVQRSEDTRKFFKDTATDHMFSTPEETRARVENEIKRWREFIKTAKIEPT